LGVGIYTYQILSRYGKDSEMARDSKNLTDAVEYFDPLSEDQKSKARLTVCGLANDAEDAKELMLALGIHPSQDDDPVPQCGSFTQLTSPSGGIRL
jgi:hypothetical protein